VEIEGCLSNHAARGLFRLANSKLIKGMTNALHATGTVEGPTEDSMGNTPLGFTLKAMIDRTAYGVSWNADLPRGGRALSDEVEPTAELEFIRPD
jgi:polyisoprenoid-binding protein YceI